MSSNAFINKYRPITFNEVLGNSLAVKSLENALASGSSPHSFLFSGPSGTGKTSLARIIAATIDAHIDEIDAATNRGIDAMKLIIQSVNYQPLYSASRMLIIDEAHGLTKDAWDALLKTLEEPPECLFIALCTTSLDKIPETIRTRCFHTILKPLKSGEIGDLITTVADIEGWVIDASIFNGIVMAATGQPRKALSILQVAHACTSMKELGELVAAIENDSMVTIDLCKFLIAGGKDWPKIQKMLGGIDDFDEALSTAGRYLANQVVSSELDKAKLVHRLLGAMLFPRNGYDKKALLVAALCDFLWN